MREISSSSFGLTVAYLIPGFTAVWGISAFSETIHKWLSTSTSGAPSVGGFFLATLASLAAGMIVNAFRWLTIDHLHHATGVRYPELDFARLQHGLGAYRLLVEFYYRYHECFGNMLVAGTFSYVAWRVSHNIAGFSLLDLAFFGTATLLYIGSRDCLQKYYRRTEQLLRRLESTTPHESKPDADKVKPSVASSPVDSSLTRQPIDKCLSGKHSSPPARRC